MKILKQLFCKHEWITTTERDGAMWNLKTNIIHNGLIKEYRFCKKCSKKELRIIEEVGDEQ